MCAKRRVPENTEGKNYDLVLEVWRQGGNKSGAILGPNRELFAEFLREHSLDLLKDKLYGTRLLPRSVTVPQVRGGGRKNAIRVSYVVWLKNPPKPIEQNWTPSSTELEEEEALIDGEQ